MSPSSFVEETQVVAQAEPKVPPFERVAILLGLSSLLAVLGTGLALYLAKFQVDRQIVTAVLWAVVIIGIVTFFRTRPASKLTPTERMVRSNRHIFFLLGLLTGVAVLGCIVTASQLNTGRDWMRLAMAATSPIAIGFFVKTRFTMGPG